MEPYHQVFPHTPDPVITLNLKKKTGTIPKGVYGFIECYCIEPGCDCRRVLLVVVNEKFKEKAVISFAFDQQDSLAGPFLQPSSSNAPYAEKLLEFFVDALNSGPQWLNRLYRHYRAVRKLVDGRPYAGKPLPKPGRLLYRVAPPPDLETLIEQSLQRTAVEGSSSCRARAGGAYPRPRLAQAPAPKKSAHDIQYLLQRYLKLSTGGTIAEHAALQKELQRYLQANSQAADEVASLLPALCQQSPENHERMEAGFRILFDALDLLRLELDRCRPAARVRMEKLQSALAQRVFIENEDLDLCAAVSQILLQSRVEILPVLREANSQMLKDGAARCDLLEEPGEEMLTGIARSLDSMGVTSPFEGAEALLQLFALNEPEMQIALVAEMFQAENPLLREISALMLFHPNQQVRLGVSELLPVLDGRSITPQTLRRLIVARNWFPEEIKRSLDLAVSNARKARVQCAALIKAPAMTVYASTIDGVGAQSFQVIVPDGKGFLTCSILIKQGFGVADAFVVALADKRELNGFVGMLRREASFIQTTGEYLDLRVSQALADGICYGNAPGYWLLCIAELLGCDHWQATAFDAYRELDQLREHLQSLFPKFLDRQEYLSALQESAEWQKSEPILRSWFEDDDSVDHEIEASRGKGDSLDAGLAVQRIEKVVLEKHRSVWLERLVVTTLWLKSSPKAPLAWYRMFHVARAIADAGVPLSEIPLMQAVARLSLHAYLKRRSSGRSKSGPLR
jgi:hypothetical protein